jgi:hypothetical protein
MRILCQFSCGATSAVATKLTLAQRRVAEVHILNAFIAEEHPDNRRFLKDCEKWFDHPITVMKSEKYNGSVIEVFTKKRFMKGMHGAPCSMELKRKLLATFQEPDDVIVLGYSIEEVDRPDDFRDKYPSLLVSAPLIENGLSKSDCKAMVERAGIELPITYRMGYDNANCLGCVKGGEGYFRAIKEDFPDYFERLAAIQEEIGPGAYLFRNRKTGERYSLRDIPPGKAYRNEELPSCSFFCEDAETFYAS